MSNGSATIGLSLNSYARRAEKPIARKRLPSLVTRGGKMLLDKLRLGSVIKASAIRQIVIGTVAQMASFELEKPIPKHTKLAIESTVLRHGNTIPNRDVVLLPEEEVHTRS